VARGIERCADRKGFSDVMVASKKRVKASVPIRTRLIREVTRSVPKKTSNLLWGRAAGRCEFRGHNAPLWKSPVTGEGVDIAEKAHIWSFSVGGPRGRKGISAATVNSIANFILVCRICHRLIDDDKKGERYSAVLLQQMKAEHERRIELATAVDGNRRTHVVHYSANIGDLAAGTRQRV
jgi:hypothetical protein